MKSHRRDTRTTTETQRLQGTKPSRKSHPTAYRRPSRCRISPVSRYPFLPAVAAVYLSLFPMIGIEAGPQRDGGRLHEVPIQKLLSPGRWLWRSLSDAMAENTRASRAQPQPLNVNPSFRI